MKLGSREMDFKGSGALFLGHLYLSVLVTAPLLSLCLMGASWLPLFLGMMSLTLPAALLIGLLISWQDGFSFDDEQQQIVRLSGAGIPFASITQIDIRATGWLLQVRIRQGGQRSATLSYALRAGDRQRLREELLKRFPRDMVLEKRLADLSWLSMVMATVVLLTAGLHGILYRNDPQLRVVPQKTAWSSTALPTQDGPHYSAGSFLLSLPGNFTLRGEGDNAFLFVEGATRAEVTIMFGPPTETFAPRSGMIRFMTGIQDHFDALSAAYHARFGIITLVLKKTALAGLQGVSIFEIQQQSLKGFATVGEKGGNEFASVLLTDMDQRAELNILVTCPTPVERKTLDMILEEIVSGIHVRMDAPLTAAPIV